MKMLSNIHKWRLTFFLSISVMLAVSCAPEKNCMICTEVRDDGRFAGFDTTYVSVRSLKDKWVLDSLKSAGVTYLSDTLIICFLDGKIFFPPRVDWLTVKSDSTYIIAVFNEWRGHKVTYYDAIADILYRADGTLLPKDDSMEEFFTEVASRWDIKTIEQLLKEHKIIRKGVYSKLVRLVRKDNKIKQWDEYVFNPIEDWEVSKLLQEKDSSD